MYTAGPTKCEQDKKIDPEGVYEKECGLEPVSFSISLDENPYPWASASTYSLIFACTHSGTFQKGEKWHKERWRDLREWVGGFGFSVPTQSRPVACQEQPLPGQRSPLLREQVWKSWLSLWSRLMQTEHQPNKTVRTKPEQTKHLHVLLLFWPNDAHF